jgi:hypothetical protein
MDEATAISQTEPYMIVDLYIKELEKQMKYI